MDLLVDIGNTSVKWAGYQDCKLSASNTLQHRAGGFDGLYRAWQELPHPISVTVSNVSGIQAQERIGALVEELWHIKPLFAQVAKRAYGITVAYGEPERLGVDRWLVMIAARRRSQQAAIVVDCGTAATLDAIDVNGKHLGGLIAPGLRLMWTSLFAGTRIPVADYKPYKAVFGMDTQECIAGAALQALAGMTERASRELSQRTGTKPMLILTGSDAPALAEQLEMPSILAPDLVLEGLSALLD